MSVFSFDTGLTVNLDDYPPPPIAWAYHTVDSVCWILQCQPWREWLGITTGWLSSQYKVPAFNSQYPPLLSFSEFHETSHSPSLFESLFEYVQQPSTNLADPRTIEGIAGIFIVMMLLRTVKRILLPVFSKFGRTAAIQTHGKEWVDANEIRITKFGEYVYRLCFHSAIALYGIYFLFEPWWGNNLVFDGYPLQPVSPPMTWYYLLQAAYNADAFVSLLELSLEVRKGRLAWSSSKRGDFIEMLVHHIATNLLVFGSSTFRLHRIGSSIFFLHDVSDVPVDLSKLANFLKWKITTVTCFTIMTLTWMCTRLYILPFHIFSTVLFDSNLVLAHGLSPLYYVVYRHFFYVCLGLLISLHAVWFMMFMKMLKTLLLKNEVHDYSEHKNGESSPDKKQL